MNVTAKTLANSAYVPTTAATIYTAPSLTTTIVDKCTMTNTSATAATVNIYIVPSGGTLGASNLITSALSIPGNTAQVLNEMQNQILNAGDMIAVSAATASVIVARISGREIA